MEGSSDLSALFDATTAAANEAEIEVLVRDHFVEADAQLDAVLEAVGTHVLPADVIAAARERVTHEWLVRVAIWLRRRADRARHAAAAAAVAPAVDIEEEPAAPAAAAATTTAATAAPRKKRERKEFDIDEFMADLRRSCEPPAAVAPLAPVQQQQPGQLDAAIMLSIGTMMFPPPRAYFHHLLLLGYMVRTILQVEGGGWYTVSEALGLSDASARSNVEVTRALVLFYDLIYKREMYQLRHFRPTDKGMIIALEKHHGEIVEWLDDHPDELLWWNNNDQDPPVIEVHNHKGKAMNWIDWHWL